MNGLGDETDCTLTKFADNIKLGRKLIDQMVILLYGGISTGGSWNSTKENTKPFSEEEKPHASVQAEANQLENSLLQNDPEFR